MIYPVMAKWLKKFQVFENTSYFSVPNFPITVWGDKNFPILFNSMTSPVKWCKKF